MDKSDGTTQSETTKETLPVRDVDSEEKEKIVNRLGEGLPDLIADDPEELGDEDKKKEPEGPALLDLAFGMDCTGSMSSYINQARSNIRTIVEDIVSKEKADIRLALVEYRDHPPQDSSFVTRVHDFSASVRDMKGWLDACSAAGGGDGPEAVADALHQILKLNWRQEATKMCVFISDAPPHGLGIDSGDGFPNGCPDGLDPMQIANQMAEKSITLYAVGCEPSINRYKDFFTALAHITGGQYVPLTKAKLLSAVIVGGAQEEISLQHLMEEVNQEVLNEVADMAEEEQVGHDELASRIHKKMKLRGHVTQQLQMNSTNLPKASVWAQEISYCSDMGAVRSKLPGAPGPGASFGSVGRGGRGGRGGRRGRGGRGGRSRSPIEVADGGEAEYVGDSFRRDEDDVYAVKEVELVEEQVSRLVSKSLAANKLRSKTVAKE